MLSSTRLEEPERLIVVKRGKENCMEVVKLKLRSHSFDFQNFSDLTVNFTHPIPSKLIYKFVGSRAFLLCLRACFPNGELIGNEKVSLFKAVNRQQYLPFAVITRYIRNRPRNKNQHWRTLTGEYVPKTEPKWQDPDYISKNELTSLRTSLKSKQTSLDNIIH